MRVESNGSSVRPRGLRYTPAFPGTHRFGGRLWSSLPESLNPGRANRRGEGADEFVARCDVAREHPERLVGFVRLAAAATWRDQGAIGDNRPA